MSGRSSMFPKPSSKLSLFSLADFQSIPSRSKIDLIRRRGGGKMQFVDRPVGLAASVFPAQRLQIEASAPESTSHSGQLPAPVINARSEPDVREGYPHHEMEDRARLGVLR